MTQRQQRMITLSRLFTIPCWYLAPHRAIPVDFDKPFTAVWRPAEV